MRRSIEADERVTSWRRRLARSRCVEAASGRRPRPNARRGSPPPRSTWTLPARGSSAGAERFVIVHGSRIALLGLGEVARVTLQIAEPPVPVAAVHGGFVAAEPIERLRGDRACVLEQPEPAVGGRHGPQRCVELVPRLDLDAMCAAQVAVPQLLERSTALLRDLGARLFDEREHHPAPRLGRAEKRRYDALCLVHIGDGIRQRSDGSPARGSVDGVGPSPAAERVR